jgi:hypothetical protein
MLQPEKDVGTARSYLKRSYEAMRLRVKESLKGSSGTFPRTSVSGLEVDPVFLDTGLGDNT